MEPLKTKTKTCDRQYYFCLDIGTAFYWRLPVIYLCCISLCMAWAQCTGHSALGIIFFAFSLLSFRFSQERSELVALGLDTCIGPHECSRLDVYGGKKYNSPVFAFYSHYPCSSCFYKRLRRLIIGVYGSGLLTKVKYSIERCFYFL